MTDFVLESPSQATASATDVYRRPMTGTLTARESSFPHAAIFASALAAATASGLIGLQIQAQANQTARSLLRLNPSFFSSAKHSEKSLIQLTQEEHDVFRLAILDSAEIVSRGRFVEL